MGTRLIHLRSGRQLSYCEYGDAAGRACFYHHGTPGSRLEPQFGDQSAREYGYRIIALDRPGIGSSDYVRGRRLLDWPKDVGETAELLEIDRFGVIGVSGGAAYALACCHAMPEQLDFAVLMGSWGPVAEEPALWDDMAPLDRFFGRLSRFSSWAFYVPFSLVGYAARRMSPQQFARSIDSSMSDADRDLVSAQEMAQFFAEDVAEAFRQGVRGPADDAILLYRHWGFGLEEIEVEVCLHHGEEDKFAPLSHARYLDEALPYSRLRIHAGAGHLFVVRLFATVFEQLSQQTTAGLRGGR